MNKVSINLEQLEQVIERGQARFYDVGSALSQINENQLYKESFPTFEAYCKERWSLTPQRCYELISIANIYKNIESETMPDKAVYLTRLSILTDPEHVNEAWDEVLRSGSKITGKLVENIAKKHYVKYAVGGRLYSLVEAQETTPDRAFKIIKVLEGKVPDYYVKSILNFGLGESCIDPEAILLVRRYEYEFKNEMLDILRSGLVEDKPLYKVVPMDVENYVRHLRYEQRKTTMLEAGDVQADRLSKGNVLVMNGFDIASLGKVSGALLFYFPEKQLSETEVADILEETGFRTFMLVGYSKDVEPVLQFDGYEVLPSDVVGNKPFVVEQFIKYFSNLDEF